MRGYRAIGYVCGPAPVGREEMDDDPRESVDAAATAE